MPITINGIKFKVGLNSLGMIGFCCPHQTDKARLCDKCWKVLFPALKKLFESQEDE